jgi:hypothetical protein
MELNANRVKTEFLTDTVKLDLIGGNGNAIGPERRDEFWCSDATVEVIGNFVDPWEARQALVGGFRIDVRIVIETTRPDLLKVASGALFRHGGSWQVYRVRNSKAELVPVAIGASNWHETEIREGLERGDLVILHPTDQVRSSIRVSSS